MLHAIISIHDLAPDTFSRVSGLIDSLPAIGRKKLSLLVIPGGAWQPQQIHQLQQWQREGMRLCGHGWHHRARSVRGIYHRLHAWLISRDAAEHLALSRSELKNLVQRNFDWFAEHDLEAPDCYVPPAWAMGKLNAQDLQDLPFRYYENTSGYVDSATGRHIALPLAGFEADQVWRQWSLNVWNGINRAASSRRRPLRISIHPYDAEYRLKDALRRYLEAVTETYCYRELPLSTA